MKEKKKKLRSPSIQPTKLLLQKPLEPPLDTVPFTAPCLPNNTLTHNPPWLTLNLQNHLSSKVKL